MPEPLWRADTAPQRQNANPAVNIAKRDAEPDKTPQVIKKERTVIHAFLNASGQERERGTNTVNDPPCYAIIGRGFAATVDHATLVQSTEWAKERLGSLPVLHIGFADPWRSYHPHNMNQELELLTLPGYAKQPDESDAGVMPDDDGNYRWLRSTSFARINQSEIGALASEPENSGLISWAVGLFKTQPPPVLAASVANIAKQEEGGNYKITFHESSMTITAAKIDICTGPGAGRTKFAQAANLTADLETRSDTPWVPRLYTATNITLENARMASEGLVLVRGAGPAAAQAVERALEEGATQILWIGKDINSSFPGTLRLDWLVKGNGAALPPRTGVPAPELNLSPSPANLCIADGYEIDSLEVIAGDDPRWNDIPSWTTARTCLRKKVEGDSDSTPLYPTVLVKFTRMRDKDKRDKVDPACRNSNGEVIEEIVYGLFHQVIVATGLETGPKDTGSAFGFADSLRDAAAALLAQRSGANPLFVGFETADHQVRWLGGAGHGSSKPADAKNDLISFEATLPAQARIFQQGVTLCALTVAMANRWFCGTSKTLLPNKNVNTASLGELDKLVGSLAPKIHEIRKRRTRPFVSLEQVAQAIVFYTEWTQNPSLLNELKQELSALRNYAEQQRRDNASTENTRKDIFDVLDRIHILEREIQKRPADLAVVTNSHLADVGIDERLDHAVQAALDAITGKLIVKYDPGIYGARRF